MIRARVWLGSNRQDWYWICPICKGPDDNWTPAHNKQIGGVAESASRAGDLAREHMNNQHYGVAA